jgi:(5-formylfuran-3-yl)methyl phosphate synthase
LENGLVKFLASVTSLADAQICVSLGADIIDCKDPAKGALGALAHETVAAIKTGLPDKVVSATIGDLPSLPDAVLPAVTAMATTGVDYIKIGLFPGGDARATIEKLGSLRLNAGLVGLLLADQAPDWELVPVMAKAHFNGVMLDTARKGQSALPDILGLTGLSQFIRRAHEVGLFAGLAGSLALRHIPCLLPLSPDILGFRGGLCCAGSRTAELDAEAIAAVRRAIAPSPLNAESVQALAERATPMEAGSS